METTRPAAAMETSKLTTNCGKSGAMRPYPSAMMNAAVTITQISRGICGFCSGLISPLGVFIISAATLILQLQESHFQSLFVQVFY